MSGPFAAGAEQEGPWLFHGPAATRAAALPPDAVGLPDAVLFDRDGTLVVDVPYNGDPARVVPMPSAVEALAAVRALGIPVGVVSNQSGVARGILTYRQVAAVQRRVDAFLGPIDVWAVCPHGPDDGCRCRKPAPGLVLAACERLGVCPARTAVIGDIGSDVAAALAAGARGVLVPTPATRPEEIAAAPDTAPDLLRAVRLVLDPTARCHRTAAPPLHRSAPVRGGTASERPPSGHAVTVLTAGAGAPGGGTSVTAAADPVRSGDGVVVEEGR
ncbi:D-glycero-alpha-D-manno-heptose-1,7-bisphosphate 7-phosphatase [Streptomyces sp. NPDC002835]